jgi:hypothetical protein
MPWLPAIFNPVQLTFLLALPLTCHVLMSQPFAAMLCALDAF